MSIARVKALLLLKKPMLRTKAFWNFQKKANELRTQFVHASTWDSAWPLQQRTCSLKRICNQNFRLCSCLILQFRCDYNFLTRISRAILNSSLTDVIARRQVTSTQCTLSRIEKGMQKNWMDEWCEVKCHQLIRWTWSSINEYFTSSHINIHF